MYRYYYQEIALSELDKTYYTAHTVSGQKGIITGTATPNPYMDSTNNVIVLLDYTSQPPVADAGADQTVDENQAVILDGSGSTDDFGIVSYEWSGLGLNGTLIGMTQNVSFNLSGTYNITLTM